MTPEEDGERARLAFALDALLAMVAVQIQGEAGMADRESVAAARRIKARRPKPKLKERPISETWTRRRRAS